jgi:hypothetical protein
MLPRILCFMGLPELGVIVSVAVLLFGGTAVMQNPMLTGKQKILWMLTIIVLNWIGLLWYYYTFYMKDKEED